MAQWNGQFTGNTHGTKALDCEHTLRHAVEVFKAASEDVKSSKAKAVKKLAVKVLNARLKVVKARLSDTTPDAKEWENKLIQVEHLQKLERALQSAGVAGVLFEFGAEELATDNRD